MDKWSQAEFEHKLNKYQEAYQHGESLITDSQYDDMVDEYEKRFGVKYARIGAEPLGEKVTLPFYMGSIDKAKGNDAQKVLERWARKYPPGNGYVMADKLDGMAGLYIKEGIKRRLYTRGNGSEGTDITYLLQYIRLPNPEGYDFAVVGEIILPKEEFKLIGGSNPRNVGSGLINSKTPNIEHLKKLHFVAYNIRDISLANGQRFPVGTQQQQFVYLQQLGFELPWWGISSDIRVEILTNYLSQRKAQSPYDLDGLVITANDKEYPHLVGENPNHSIAFKVDIYVDTVVTNIIWKASKDGKLKPVVHFEPRYINVNVSKASGNNAQFIYKNQLGIGSTITITRAGDVIPYIYAVLTPGTMIWPSVPCHWNESNVELIVNDIQNDNQVHKERIIYFVRHMGIENLGPGRIELIYNAGYHTIKSFLNLKVSDLSNLPGLGLKSGQDIVDRIQTMINGAPLYKVMVSSGAFGEGFGVEKARAILDAYPNIFNYYGSPKGTVAYMLRQIGGFDKQADVFEERMGNFLQWISDHPDIKYIMPTKEEIKASNGDRDLAGLVILFTGITSKQFRPQLETRGAIVKDNYSKNVNLIVAIDPSRMTEKAQQASAAGKKIISLDEFKRIYDIK